MKGKRPHLMDVLKSYEHQVGNVVETGLIPDDLSLQNMGERVKRTLAADQEEAARGNCIWASMEWKWQEYA